MRCSILALVVLTSVLPGACLARVFSTVDGALGVAFPDCAVERRTVFLSDAERDLAQKLSGVPVASALVHPYTVTCADRPGATAYFDAHRVRTLPETLMITVDAEGRVGRVEILSFDEPEEYIPRAVWYEQFEGESLDDDLQLSRGIDGVTGATLTARSTTAAVRRVLALHRVLSEKMP